MSMRRTTRRLGAIAKRSATLALAGAATLLLFLILPLIQAIHQPLGADTLLQSVDTAALPPPPPPPPEEEPEEEPEPDEQPPELVEDVQPLDLSQLELALNPGFGQGLLAGDFAIKLGPTAGQSEDVDALFSLADLDQKPRVVHQPSPVVSAKLKPKTPATVHVVFVVDQRGRVEQPTVQNASDPSFEAPAIAAVRQWRFEPGKRNGQPVRFRMRVPITFPESR